MLPRLTPKQRQRANALIKRLCANYDNGSCLALDDGEPCACVQSISYSLLCKYFRKAVLPAEPFVDLRVFDLLNICRINNNRAEEMLLCIYHLLQPDRRIDEGIYNDEIDQYFSYREWKKKHQPLSGVTVREILTTEDLNEGALLRIFDGVTAAFYKSDEYNSREYRYSSLSELRKAMKHKEGGTNGKAQ